MNALALDEADLPARPSSGFFTHVPAVEKIIAGFDLCLPGYHVWRERGTTDWLLLYTVSGCGRFGRGAGQVILKEHDVALVRPGTPHDYALEDGWDRWEQRWFHFHPRPHWREWLAWPEALPGVMRLRLADPAIRQTAAAFLRGAQYMTMGGLRRRMDFALNGLEAALLWLDTQNPHTDRGRLDSRVLAVMDFLCRNLSAPASPQEMSRVSGLSPSWLSHQFRVQVGLPPAQFLDQQRLAHAKAQLQNTLRPIAAVAADVGMEPPYFSHWFKRHTAVSPRDYRGRPEAAAP